MVTVTGEHFASRMASSIITNLGLEELVASNLEEYEEIAVTYANNPEKLLNLKNKIKENSKSHPLFDMKKFVKNLEEAYLLMWKNYKQGNKPKNIFVGEGKDAK